MNHAHAQPFSNMRDVERPLIALSEPAALFRQSLHTACRGGLVGAQHRLSGEGSIVVTCLASCLIKVRRPSLHPTLTV